MEAAFGISVPVVTAFWSCLFVVLAFRAHRARKKEPTKGSGRFQSTCAVLAVMWMATCLPMLACGCEIYGAPFLLLNAFVAASVPLVAFFAARP